jgi:hypothetical protein
VAALLAVVLVAWGNATSGFDAAHPRPNRIAYELDAGAGMARWVSPDHDLDAWTVQFFPAGASRGADGLWSSPAPIAALTAPDAAVVADTQTGDHRALVLHLRSPRGATDLDVLVRAPGPIITVSVGGKELDLREYLPARDGVLRLSYNAIEPAGVELRLVVRAAGRVSVVLADTSDGLPSIPGITIRPRPAETMPAPGDWHDPTVVTRSFLY